MNIKNWLKGIKKVKELNPEREAMRQLIRRINKARRKPDITCLVCPDRQKTWAGEKVYEIFTALGNMSIKADTYQNGQTTGYFIKINNGSWMRFEADSKEGRLLAKFRDEAIAMLALVDPAHKRVASAQQTLNFARGR